MFQPGQLALCANKINSPPPKPEPGLHAGSPSRTGNFLTAIAARGQSTL
jgi:hypothetical protein